MASAPKRQKMIISQRTMYSFINDYKENRILWDFKHPDYKNTEKRKAALSPLAAKYQMTEVEVKKKLNSLRSTYLQERKKVEESKVKKGEIYEPSLYWYHALDFLGDVIIPRTPAYNLLPSPPAPYSPDNCQVVLREQTSDNEEVDEEHIIFEFIPDTADKPIIKQEHCYSVPPPSSFSLKKRPKMKMVVNDQQPSVPSHKPPSVPYQQQQQPLHQHDHVISHTAQFQTHDGTFQSAPSIVQQEDEFDKFCSSIASQLRTLPTADAVEMQLEIQQLVSKRRLAVLLKNQQNLSILRTWENATSNGYDRVIVGNDSGEEEQSDKFIIEQ